MDQEGDIAGSGLNRAGRSGLSVDRRFGVALESLPIALVLTGPGGIIEVVNREADIVFGYARTELQGNSLDMLIPERFRARCHDLRRLFPVPTSAGIVDDGEDLFGLRKDGTEFPLEIGFNPIDVDGEPMMLAGIIDITARRNIELEKEQQRAGTGTVQRRSRGIRLCRLARSEGTAARDRASGAMDRRRHRADGQPGDARKSQAAAGRVARLQMLAGRPAGLFARRSHPDAGRGGGYRRGGARGCRDAGAAARLRRRLRGDDAGDPHPPHADPSGAGESDRQCAETPRPCRRPHHRQHAADRWRDGISSHR